eukprot:6580525-Pyramimonas_sp.AAC.1
MESGPLVLKGARTSRVEGGPLSKGGPRPRAAHVRLETFATASRLEGGPSSEGGPRPSAAH